MKLGLIATILESDSTSPGSTTALDDQEPIGYSIDSRTVRAGELFFAIRGEKNDGHLFVADALDKGAVAAVVQRHWVPDERTGQRPLIRVDDTLIALQRLARAVVSDWRGRVVAITGSMGKTTTKELTAAALSGVGSLVKTVGNLNNAYGLPLSVLRMESNGEHACEFDFAVLEMGMNHRGEIAELTRIAPPDVGVVTNVSPVHLEFFSSIDEIAEAKSEMVAGIKPGGIAVLNADDSRVAAMRNLRADIEVRTFGIDCAADVAARDVTSTGLEGARFMLVTPRGQLEASLKLPGAHNLYNALAAAAVADIYEAPLEEIARSLAGLSNPKMRGEVVEFEEGFSLIDDSYNSNPRALVEMVNTISGVAAQRRVVVAGEMLELGQRGPELHREAGRHLATRNVDLLIGVRGLAREIVEGAREAGLREEAALFCETPDEAADVLAGRVRAGDLILVKGSRGVRTEIVVERLKQRFPARGRG
jgi:UDP-N-acetylmuramoyl-tripeptide--D-alanyl-D-alanine ligase